MSADERIRVMIVDDHSIVRVGLKQVLEQAGGFEVVGEAADGEEAVRVAADVSPDVVLMDVMMPNKGGVEACREIMESAPETRVVMLTALAEEDAIVDAVAAGATGYLQKETDREQLLSAVRTVALGNLRLPPESVRRAFEAKRGAGKTEDAAVGLTPREREILVSFAQGMSYARIAEARAIKPVTVRNAIYGIQKKLGRDDAGAGALVRAERTGGRLYDGRLGQTPLNTYMLPDSNSAVSVVKPETEDCDAQGAICTKDGSGRMLSNRLEFTVSGRTGKRRAIKPSKRFPGNEKSCTNKKASGQPQIPFRGGQVGPPAGCPTAG